MISVSFINTHKHMKTIAVIDLYPIILRGMERFLTSNVNDCNIILANNFNHLVGQIGDAMPDVIIIGISSVDRAGTQNAIKLCHTNYSQADLIVSDDQICYDSVVSYLKWGAKGCILKKGEMSEITSCLNTIENQKQYLSPALMQLVLDRVACQSNTNAEQSQNSKSILTSRELEIAKHLIEGNKTSRIAEELGRKPSTISTIKKSVFRKLNVDNVFALKRVIAAY
jgi:DNA-binding NarL/FixJ family response regulator